MNLLIVDDTPMNGKLLTGYLSEIPGLFTTTFTDPEEALGACDKSVPDFILVDYLMPKINGIEFIQRLRKQPEFDEVPIVMITAVNERAILREALEAGANDFLSRPVDEFELRARVRNMLKLRTRTLALQELAISDPLTNVFNRRYFWELVEKELNRARRYNASLSILLLDADHFKQINDTYGHACGDTALCELCNLCREMIRETDIIGRIGGEEFAICLPQTAQEDADALAERIRQAIESSTLESAGQKVTYTVSIGVTELSASDLTADDIIARADSALYSAKAQGRNQVISI
ncbi:diguanylate cyclase [Motiliproteus sp. MSK22-1]|uniref:diguanylate cyclase n=1 Tax=Motiliproteus sp. MSK22-1 TaxID=1897630 RepID=UPI000977A77F|nr:diguanylate cyclase [Motiliproteus sp. MSK22-1]OMH28390.1 hypothetical protein BGP75_21050 [Motiliproteus sp. MSK22-1]